MAFSLATFFQELMIAEEIGAQLIADEQELAAGTPVTSPDVPISFQGKKYLLDLTIKPVVPPVAAAPAPAPAG
jgi:hypothetical protein